MYESKSYKNHKKLYNDRFHNEVYGCNSQGQMVFGNYGSKLYREVDKHKAGIDFDL